jgi:hypothetical protein
MALNPQQQGIIINEIKRSLGKKDGDTLTPYELAKGSMRFRRSVWHNIRSVMFMCLGILSASFALEGFLIPAGLIDGGVTGISLLTSRQTDIPLPVLLIVINIPFI